MGEDKKNLFNFQQDEDSLNEDLPKDTIRLNSNQKDIPRLNTDSVSHKDRTRPASLHLPISADSPENKASPGEYEGNHSDKEFKKEPCKFAMHDEKKESSQKSRKKTKFRVRSGSTITHKKVPLKVNPSYGIASPISQVSRTPNIGKIFIVIAILIAGFLVYKHRNSLQLLGSPYLEKMSSIIDRVINKAGNGLPTATNGPSAGINSVRDKTFSVSASSSTAIAGMQCYDLLPKIRKIKNLSHLSFAAQFAVAECLYLEGDLLGSFKILERNEANLSHGSLLLYVILLLKRKQFSTVSTLLHGRCYVHSSSENNFFSCLAKSLYQVVYTNKVSFNLNMDSKHYDNPYSSIALLVSAIQRQEYDLSSDYIAKAIRVAENATRPVALAYIYETVIGKIYIHGTISQAKEVLYHAAQDLQGEYPQSIWWVIFLTRLKTGNDKKKQVLLFVSDYNMFSRMFNNLDFLRIIGTESIKFGYIDTLETLINKTKKYQRHTYRSSSYGALKFLDTWKLRILIAGNRYRDVMRSLKSYVNSYRKDYFYYFYRGVVLMKVLGENDTKNLASMQFARSISLRNSWEANYAYASSLLKKRRTAKLTAHLRKLDKMAVSRDKKNWLFLLRTETKISAGNFNSAITDLLRYMDDNPKSFAAHRLLISAYNRSEQLQKASIIRRSYDRLQKTVTYYSTREGETSPLGPFSLL